jgi:hypothetical protein
MDMEVDKSEDELELERLVFGDSEGLIKSLTKQSTEKSTQRTELEQLDDDQAFFAPRFLTVVILHRLW